MPTNLLLRGGRYSARLFVPADLRAHVGRCEIVKSLGTNNRKFAKILLRRIQHIAERLFLLARLDVVDKSKITILLLDNIHAALGDPWGSDVTLTTLDTASRVKNSQSSAVCNEADKLKPVTQMLSLKQAISEWLELKSVKGLATGTMEMYEVSTALALRFFGQDYRLRQLNNREMLRFVKHEQSRLVKNITLIKRVRLIKDVVNLACVNHDLPVPTFKIELKDDAANVLPYTAEELNQLFLLINGTLISENWKYWAILISLLAGLRRVEVVALRIKDVKQHAGRWYFDITDSKTAAGIRCTPVSNFLISLGFLNFYNRRLESGEEFLLMGWKPMPKRSYGPIPATKYGDFFSNLSMKFIKSLGKNEKKDLHSLRHNYCDALKQGGVRPDIIDELSGHEHAPRSMRSIYDEKFSIDILADNLCNAAWKCDFSLLSTWIYV